MAEQMEPDDGRIGTLMAGIDPASVLQLFMRWAGIEEMTQETCAEIGAAALAAQTVPEDEWVAYFEDHLDGAALAREAAALDRSRLRNRRLPDVGPRFRRRSGARRRFELRGTRPLPGGHDQRPPLHRRRRALGHERGPCQRIRRGPHRRSRSARARTGSTRYWAARRAQKRRRSTPSEQAPSSSSPTPRRWRRWASTAWTSTRRGSDFKAASSGEGAGARAWRRTGRRLRRSLTDCRMKNAVGETSRLAAVNYRHATAARCRSHRGAPCRQLAAPLSRRVFRCVPRRRCHSRPAIGVDGPVCATR